MKFFLSFRQIGSPESSESRQERKSIFVGRKSFYKKAETENAFFIGNKALKFLEYRFQARQPRLKVVDTRSYQRLFSFFFDVSSAPSCADEDKNKSIEGKNNDNQTAVIRQATEKLNIAAGKRLYHRYSAQGETARRSSTTKNDYKNKQINKTREKRRGFTPRLFSHMRSLNKFPMGTTVTAPAFVILRKSEFYSCF